MPSEAYTRRELLLLGVILTAGIFTRVCLLSRSAVEHFDEGVYASNLYFDPPDYAYPQQRFYAPPLLPALIEAGMIAGLPPNLAALLPSFLAGCGTIVAIWWLGRSWFSPEVGLSAAALVALNDVHIVFSTTALTDVLLGLWLVLAVDAMARSLLSGDFRWSVVAGIYTGLAWWTKYNGWLPLAIEAAALPLLWLWLRPPARELRAWAACLAITGWVAALVWCPYYLSLQSQGGYGPIAANHAKYVVGLAGWWHSAARQITNQFVLGDVGNYCGLALAIFATGVLIVRRSWLGHAWFGAKCFVLGTFGLFLLTGGFALSVGAAVGLAHRFWLLRKQQLDAASRRCAIGLTLVGVWWAALVVATPLYTPYPRLVLPCVLAACLACALNMMPDLILAGAAQITSRHFSGVLIVCFFGLGWLMFTLFPHEDHLRRQMDRRGLVEVARQVRATDTRIGHRVIYVFGEPALYFQLKVAGEAFVSPIAELPPTAAAFGGQPIPTFLIAGPHAHHDPQFAQQMAAAQDRWELVNEFDYSPSAVVWLDLHDPRQSPQETAKDDRVRLYRLRQ